MKNKFFSRELKIGLFAILIIGSLYFTIQFLKGSDLFSGTSTYYAAYSDLGGLAPTSPVSVLGLTAGTVDDIHFDQQNKLMVVKIKLKKNFLLPKGTVAEIYSADILGGKAIRLLLSDASNLHRSGDTLASAIQRDITSILTQDLGFIKEDITNLLSKLDVTVTQINHLLDAENREQVQEILQHLNHSLKDINSFTKSLAGHQKTVDRVITGTDTLITELNKAADKLAGTLHHFEGISSQIKESDVAGILDGLKELIDGLNNPEGSLSQLTSNPELYHSVNDILSRADSLIRMIGDNPKKYLKISVF